MREISAFNQRRRGRAELSPDASLYLYYMAAYRLIARESLAVGSRSSSCMVAVEQALRDQIGS